jgi:hypothetical protein
VAAIFDEASCEGDEDFCAAIAALEAYLQAYWRMDPANLRKAWDVLLPEA